MTISDKLTASSYSTSISNSDSYKDLPRFRWFGYKEGFSPSLVEDAIKKVGVTESDYILDPFNGNGTVTLTASNNNIKSVGLEVNPFTVFMSKTKQLNYNPLLLENYFQKVLLGVDNQIQSSLLRFSTFSELSGRSKWLFNSDVLNSFEGGWEITKNLPTTPRNLIRLALLGAANDNCNATKDGKCLKYRSNWEGRKFNKESFIYSLIKRIDIIKEDLSVSITSKNADITNCDSRKGIDQLSNKFKLCITSPPYLNSFDYTDIYRPELFLGKFINNNEELNALRKRTIRSHVEMILPKSKKLSFGCMYDQSMSGIINSDCLWDNQLPNMIEGYFEDMSNILLSLKTKATINAELWLVVANSVYANVEIPVDLILAEIGSRLGWKLSRIEVIRDIQRRKTKYNGNINSVRESLIVFKNANI